MIFSFPATGTLWQVEVFDQELTDKTKQLIQEYIEIFESQYSRFRSTSFLTKLANNPGTYSLPNTAKPLLDFYTSLNKHTLGIFTPTIGDTLVSAGYDQNYSLVPKPQISTAKDWSAIKYDKSTITSEFPIQLDFGAAGKGYLVDLVSNLLIEQGYQNFSIEAGGDIKIVGDTFQVIGLEHPEDKESVIGTIEVKNSSLCGSSGNRRKWANFHHIINSKEKSSPKNILSVWVTSQDCMTADGLATALFFTNPENLKSFYIFEYLILYQDYTINKSKNFSATLFT